MLEEGGDEKMSGEVTGGAGSIEVVIAAVREVV